MESSYERNQFHQAVATPQFGVKIVMPGGHPNGLTPIQVVVMLELSQGIVTYRGGASKR